MPPRPPKAAKETPVDQEKLVPKAKKASRKATATRIDQSGLTSRVKGHVSARGKRAQAKRDAR